jgi:hypothetical protein
MSSIPVVMQDGGSLQPVVPGVPTAEELVAEAVCRLLRGGTWEGLANELAWTAARSTDADLSCLEWLPELVEANTAERVDGLEFVLERERHAAWAAHQREWPHDLSGAETAAALAAREEGDRQVARLYIDVLEWASTLLTDRSTLASGRRESRVISFSAPPPTELRVPALVADGLERTRTLYGWPSATDDEIGRPEAA